jgi:DNA polymerase-3 subunit delta'
MSLIGHANIIERLNVAHGAARLAHGLCFVGPEAVGKRTAAFWLAGELLGAKNPERHADFYFVTHERDEKTDVPKHEISVEQVRRLREQLSQTSFFSGPKVAVIDEAETLSISAANALLKTLEEPPGKTTIILVTSAMEALPATIASRVQTFRFQPVTVAEMMTGGIDERLARASAGRPGIAILLRDPEELERHEGDLAEFRELVSAPVWKRAKIIESWFGKKKAHAEGIAELRGRVRLWKTVLRESLLAEAGAGELVGTPLVRDNIANAHALLLRIGRLETLVAANANVRYALEACFLT